MKRESGIDLLRCLGAFLVVGFHANLYIGYQGEAQTGVAMWAANSFYYLTVGCNGIFLMISGYLHSAKQWNKQYYKGLAGVVLGYVLASVVSIPVRHFLLGQEKSLEQWVRAFLGFSGVYYGWYVEMYLGLMLLSPILNLGMQRMTDGQLLGACVSLVFVTALPLTDYWASAYPLAYYAMGAAVRRLQPGIKPWGCICVAAGIAMGLGLVTLLSAKGGTLADGFGQTFGGVWIMGMVLAVFLGLYRVTPGTQAASVLRWMAAGTYEGYLLSHLLDGWVYGLVSRWHRPEKYGAVLIFVTIPVFLLSVGLGRILHRLVEKIKNAAR